ncbi:MAG TPA: flagellar basal-body MS-ring/collar protein FliF [Thiobacillaceae bacterium]|nr:flagellar basal-body MS-ring/collar protein FliF [Thiobacillaceae bacterium]
MALPTQQPLTTLVQRFNELPNQRKLGLLGGIAASIALFVGLLLWSSSPDYKVLFANLSERDAGSVVAALQQMNVPYQTQAGGAILVPQDKVYDVRFQLASQGLPKGGAVGFELMDNAKLGMTQFQEQLAFQRGLEGELARTIQSLSPVEAARVHLAIPKPSVFVREKQSPSASVMVNLYAGRRLDEAQVNAIVHMVGSSVPGLNASQVTVIDQAGNLLTATNSESSLQGLNSSQLDYLRKVEGYYAERIEAIVAPIVGKGNVRAEVRADLDFSLSELTSESFRPNPTPDAQAIRSQQSVEETSQGAGGPAAGVPGALTNQPPGPASAPLTAPPGANAGANTGAGAAGGTSSRKESTVNFELDKTIRHVKEPLGRIKRLSVAVVVNYRQAAGDDGQLAAKPLNPQELEQVNSLVKESMGFSQERGDTLNVVNAAFTETKEQLPDVPLWKDPDNVAFAKDLLKNLLIFGLAFYLVFGVLRPLLRDLVKSPAAVTPEGEQVSLGGEEGLPGGRGGMPGGEAGSATEQYNELLRTVREFAKQNPKLAADIVKEWLAKE